MPTPRKLYYRTSIIIFGMVVPVILFLVVAGGAWIALGRADEYLGEQTARYKGYEMSVRAMQQLQAQVGQGRGSLERWEKQISGDTLSVLNANLLEISGEYPGGRFQRTTSELTRGVSGLGAVSAQPSSQVRLTTRGTFQATQEAMLKLETKMPQLQLQEMKIEPGTSSSSALNFQFSYTAWEK